MQTTVIPAGRSQVTVQDPIPIEHLEVVVEDILGAAPIVDMHTHLFPESFGSLTLWGIDELLTYHYLEAELFRSSPIDPADYWTLPKQQQADLIWRTLFIENTPIS